MLATGTQGRGQSGIGTLLLFIAMILVATMTAGVLMDTAGFLEGETKEASQETNDQVTTRLNVIATSGVKTPTDDTKNESAIGGVQLVVTQATGSGDILVSEIMLEWIDATGSYTAAHYSNAGAGTVDGYFGHEVLADNDNSLSGDQPVINSEDDRVLIVVDLAGDDHGGNGTRWTSAYDQSGYPTIRDSGMSVDETAQIRMTTDSGSQTAVQVTVPESLRNKTSVAL